ELLAILHEKFHVRGMVCITDILPGTRETSGRLTRLTITGSNEHHEPVSISLDSQYEIRRAFSETFLFSSAFTIDTQRAPSGEIEEIRLNGAGWGHGVGLCQIGALGMALRGRSSREILKHYYRG